MATRFRALAAPIDTSTGDERRFTSNITVAPTPIPLRWPREDVGAHDGAVTIGAIDSVDMTDGEIWVEGRLFDDADPEKTPRLAEDVAHAMRLAREGVLGISVDLDDYEATVVRKGTDEPLTDTEMLDPNMQAELLITKGRIRACTLVDIPAFAETNHTFELYEDDEAVSEPEDEPDSEPELAAVTASAGALFAFDDFTVPVEIDRLMPITYDWERGIAYGHVAPWGVCHEGVSDACVLAPKDASGKYREFHAHRVETDQGTVYAGRITAGGRHPEVHDGITAHHVRHHHDDMTTVAYVRAVEDAYGIFVCGPIMPGLDEQTREVLSRRKVSADWRETVDGLSMIEVLALSPGPKAMSEPGFPVRTAFAGGRQVALVASLVPAPMIDEPDNDMTVTIIPGDSNLSMVEAMRFAFKAIKDEEEHKVEASRLRTELYTSIRADAERARADLVRTIGV